jgi:hypothetical protein
VAFLFSVAAALAAPKKNLQAVKPHLQVMALHEACVLLGVDRVHRAGVYARAAVDAGICSDNPLVAGLADSGNRAGIFAGSAVNAFLGNGMCQSIHLLLVQMS